MSKNRVSMPMAQSASQAEAALRLLFDHHFSVELALSPGAIDEVLALRYQVYCRERPFEDANCFPDGRERDEYDRRSVHALVRHGASGECVAGVRLVLADKYDPCASFPVEAHCGEAMPETGKAQIAGTPRSHIAEISRLAVSRDICQRMAQGQAAPDETADTGCLEPQVMPCVVLGLFAAIVRLTEKLGITHWMAVMEPTLLRLLKRYGIRFPHVGDVVNYHGRRRPAVARASTLLDGILASRPDVWHLITDSGATLPPRPVPGVPRRHSPAGGFHGVVAGNRQLAYPPARAASRQPAAGVTGG